MNEKEPKKQSSMEEIKYKNNQKEQKKNKIKQNIQKIVKANIEFQKKQQIGANAHEKENNQKKLITINPKNLIFENVHIGGQYFLFFTISNQTKRQRKVKVTLPKNHQFELDTSGVIVIAPGLSSKIKIIYTCKNQEELHDSFIVSCEEQQIIVDISVFPPRGIIQFDNFVDLGFVQPEQPIRFRTEFVNIGQKVSTLDFPQQDEQIVTSESFPLQIEPQKSKEVIFEANFTKVGVFRTDVVILNQSTKEKLYLILNATVVQHQYYVIDENGNELNILDFGDNILGQQLKRKITVINNSPNGTQFKVHVLKGNKDEMFQEHGQLQTPYELGQELSEQIIFVEPQIGFLEPYGHKQIMINLKTQPTHDDRLIVSKYSIQEETDNPIIPPNSKKAFNYTAFIHFDEQNSQKTFKIKAITTCPLVQLSKQIIKFSDLELGQQEQIQIDLLNGLGHLPVMITCPKEAFFKCIPKKFVLEPLQNKTVNIIFRPRNLGQYHGRYTFTINNSFDIKVEIFGLAKQAINYFQNIHQSRLPQIKGTSEIAQTQKNIQKDSQNKTTYDNKKRDMQIHLLKTQVQMIQAQKKDKNESYPKATEILDRVLQEQAPIPKSTQEKQQFQLMKPLNSQSNNSNVVITGVQFIPDPKLCLKELSSTPKDYEEAKQIQEKLTGDKLMKIQVGPTEMNFGKIFVCSQASLQFQIKNFLWQSIQGQLVIEGVNELKDTPQRTQIIPQGKVGGFKIVISSTTTKMIRERVRYVINGHHKFEFIVTAEVVPCDLELSRNVMQFKFREDSLEMTTSEILVIKNNGNASAMFKLVQNQHSPFRAFILEGIVRAGQQREIEIVYSPVSTKDEDSITMEIENGLQKVIKCIGNVNEIQNELVGNNINFGTIAVGHKKQASFMIKNTHNKHFTIFKIDENSLPEGMQIMPKTGKICPEDQQKINIEFQTHKRVDYKQFEILILIRGGSPLKAYFNVQTIIPIVDIEQKEFNFESITFGNRASLPLTIINQSPIPAELFLDLTGTNQALQEKYDCLELEPAEKTNSDSLIFERRDGNSQEKKAVDQRVQKFEDFMNQSLLNLQSNILEQSTKQVQSKSAERNYVFYLKPGKTYEYNLIFSPIKPSTYEFDIVFYIPGQEQAEALTRKVKCMGTNPQFLMEPLTGVIEFPKKIIITPESVTPDYRNLTISNPSFDHMLSWKLDITALDNVSPFQLSPSQGKIDPQCTASIRISFKPLRAQIYEAKTPLFINSETSPTTEVILRGEGQFPKSLFSAEEVILPIVPLNTPTFAYIALINDGYQNSSFKIIIPQEYQKIGVMADFVNSNILGLSSSKITVKIQFQSPVSVSFTAKIIFEDDLKRQFMLPVSGAADNSLLTYAPFLTLGYFINSFFRNQLEYDESYKNSEVEPPSQFSILIDPVTKAPKISIKGDKKQSQLNSANELQLIANAQMEQKTPDDNNEKAISYYQQLGDTIVSWLNEYGVSTINAFPEDLYNNNGNSFYELLEFFVKTPPPKPSNLPHPSKFYERAQSLILHYQQAIQFLKDNGAMINIIKPYYLLSYKEIQAYFKNNLSPGVHSNYYNITDTHFRLLSLQSWTTLFLQTLRIFFIQRINVKEHKMALTPLLERRKIKMEAGKEGVEDQETIDKMPAPPILPEYPYEKNSAYSTSECLLLRWLEVLYQLKTKEAIRIAHFEKELSNCFIFACAVDTYATGETNLIQRIKQTAIMSEDVLVNLDTFKNVLRDFGMKEEFRDSDFLKSNPVSMLLLTAHLFRSLPSYLPRQTIEFQCQLHEKIIKELVLQNPSQKAIIYQVRLFGNKNFQTDSELIKIDPKQTVQVPVSYYSNTSYPAEAKVFFQNRRNGKSVANAIVFSLKAIVSGRFSMKTFTINNVALYETGNTEITVVNPFDKDVDFKIKLDNIFIQQEAPKPVAKQANKGKKKSKANEQGQQQQESNKLKLPSFFIKQEKLWIRRGQTAKLYLQYLPITNEQHKCYIIFLDSKIGEMQYEIIGQPLNPTPQDNFKIQVPLEQLQNIEITIPVKNTFLVNALLKLNDKMKEQKEFDYLPIIDNLMNTFEKVYNIELTPSDFLTSYSPVTLEAKQQQTMPVNNQGQRFPQTASQQSSRQSISYQQKKLDLQQIANSVYKLQLQVAKRQPVKDMHVELRLDGCQKLDYRYYDIYLTILPKTMKAAIEIKTTARIPIVQNIPVTNNSDIDYIIKPVFTPIMNANLFEMPLQQFTVKKKNISNYPIKFSSPWVERAEGKLQILNITTNDNFEYQLRGECEEPLSEDHEEIYTKAKKATEIVVKIKNPIPDSRVFTAECDIPDSHYQKQVTLDSNKVYDYKISFKPIIGGTFIYQLTLTDNKERYFWYLITIHVDSPEPMKTLSLSTDVRKPLLQKIDIENMGSVTANYKIVIIGNYLQGDNNLQVQAKQTVQYNLYYFPLQVEHVYKKIGFMSEEEGEIWFDLECRSEDGKPIKLQTFRSELGKSISQLVTLRNPLKHKSTIVTCLYDEESNFNVTQKKFEIQPQDKYTVEINYVPHQLGMNENEIITFRSNEIGDWKYQVFGIGIPPIDYETIILSTVLGKSVTKSLQFKNPFKTETTFYVYAQVDEQNKDVFELLSPKSKNVTLQGLQNIQIIIKFSPVEIFTYNIRIIIKLNEQLQWVYPVLGVTEAIQNYSEFQIKAKCDQESEVSNSYHLIGITNVNPDEVFESSLKIAHKEQENIKRWLQIKPVKNKLANSGDELIFQFHFAPLKPFKTTIEFVIIKPSGGRWKFKINLVATDPEFFDILNIVSQLNVRKTIQFRLFNSDKKVSSHFVAYFTQDSDSEFLVKPTKGILEPAINDGTIIEVSYLPTQYGKTKTGVLIIETEIYLWRFLVKGMFEKYIPPNYKTGKLKNTTQIN